MDARLCDAMAVEVYSSWMVQHQPVKQRPAHRVSDPPATSGPSPPASKSGHELTGRMAAMAPGQPVPGTIQTRSSGLSETQCSSTVSSTEMTESILPWMSGERWSDVPPG